MKLRQFRAHWLIAILIVITASCSREDSQSDSADADGVSSTAHDAESDDDGDTPSVQGDSENAASGDSAVPPVAENSDDPVDPAAVTFNDTEYLFRFSDGELHEFTPAGQEDLSKWTDMLTVNLYPGFRGETDLADISNRVLTSYTTNGAIVDRTDSAPRTEEKSAEHLIVVTFNIPGASESVRARFLLVGEECVGLIHSHRTYGDSAADDMRAWIAGDGAELADKLMAWDAFPSPEELAELEAPDEPASPPPSTIPIYVTPIYNSDGPQIDVGEFSDELTGATEETILDVASAMKEEWKSLPIEAMFVLAIRLYDLGHKDEAVYWFYSAQMRIRVLLEILEEESIGGIGSPPFELKQASAAFMQLAGEYINGYGFGDLSKLRGTLRLVMEEAEPVPDFNTIYPEFELISEEEWPLKSSEVTANLQEMLDYIDENEEFIREQRRINGVEGRY